MKILLLLVLIVLGTITAHAQNLKGYTIGQELKIAPEPISTTVGGVEGSVVVEVKDGTVNTIAFVTPSITNHEIDVFFKNVEKKYAIKFIDGESGLTALKDGVQYSFMTVKNEGKTVMFFLLSDEAKIRAFKKAEKERLKNDF